MCLAYLRLVRNTISIYRSSDLFLKLQLLQNLDFVYYITWVCAIFSVLESRCYNPAIALTRFHNGPCVCAQNALNSLMREKLTAVFLTEQHRRWWRWQRRRSRYYEWHDRGYYTGYLIYSYVRLVRQQSTATARKSLLDFLMSGRGTIIVRRYIYASLSRLPYLSRVRP